MFHQFDVVVNKSTGVPVPGTIVRVYDGSDNIVPIYSDAAGTPIETVSGLTDAAVADSAGNYSFYVNDGIYTMRFYSGETLILSVPNISMQGFNYSGDGGAALVGSSGPSNVQADLDARPTSATLAATSGASLVGFLQSGTGAVARTLQSRGRDTIHVSDFATVQQAVNEAIARGACTLKFNGGTWSLGSTTIANASNLILDGGGAVINVTGDMSGPSDDDHTRTALFMFSGACENVTFQNLSIVGDGNFAHRQRAFGYTYGSPPTLTNLSVLDCTFRDLLAVCAFPGVQGLTFSRFKIKNLLGEASGQGYGINTELANTTRSEDILIGPGLIENSTRHGIYINHSDNVLISGVRFKEHRKDLFSSSTGSTGRAALILSRCSKVTVTGCVFDQCRDAALGIDQDGTYTVEDVSVENCIFAKTLGSSINVGRTGNAGEARAISFRGITLDLNPSWLDADINATDCKGLTFDGVFVRGDVAFAGNRRIFKLSEYSAAYWERVVIRGVRGVISNASGSGYLVELSAGLCASSGGTIELLDNRLDGAAPLYNYLATPANANLRTDWDYVLDVTAAGTVSASGYNRFNIQLGSAGNITDFTNGYDGQTIEVFFANGNATLKATNLVLAGAADFVGTSNDVVRLRKMAKSSNRWVELGRSVN